MLFNPKWEQQTKRPNLYSLTDLIAWLETKDPAETYEYYNCRGGCLMGQYMKHCGGEWDLDVFLSDAFYPIRRCSAGGDKTFGAALERARKFVA